MHSLLQFAVRPMALAALAAGCASVESHPIAPLEGREPARGIAYHLAKTDLLVSVDYRLFDCAPRVRYGFLGAEITELVGPDRTPAASFVIDPAAARGATKTLDPLHVVVTDGLLTRVTYDPADRSRQIAVQAAQTARKLGASVTLGGPAAVLGGGEEPGGCNRATTTALTERDALRAAERRLAVQRAELLANPIAAAEAKTRLETIAAQRAAIDAAIDDIEGRLTIRIERRIEPGRTECRRAGDACLFDIAVDGGDLAKWLNADGSHAARPSYQLALQDAGASGAIDVASACRTHQSYVASGLERAIAASTGFSAVDSRQPGGIYYRLPVRHETALLNCYGTDPKALIRHQARLFQTGPIQEIVLTNGVFQDNRYDVQFVEGVPVDFTYTESVATLVEATTAADGIVDAVVDTPEERAEALRAQVDLVEAQTALIEAERARDAVLESGAGDSPAE